MPLYFGNITRNAIVLGGALIDIFSHLKKLYTFMSWWAGREVLS